MKGFAANFREVETASLYASRQEKESDTGRPCSPGTDLRTPAGSPHHELGEKCLVDYLKPRIG